MFSLATQIAEAPSWGPTTEVWSSKEKISYETLQERFRAADLDGWVAPKNCAEHSPLSRMLFDRLRARSAAAQHAR